MARSYGRIATTIWSDPDFLALDAEAQRLYLFLLSQPDLSHAGLLPLRERRWAKKVGRGTSQTIMAALESLAVARFIIADEDTEEVLIRTMVRNDGVWRQPKVMIRMREDARLIESPALRSAFAKELERLPLDELNDKPGGANSDQPSTRKVVQEIVDSLRADFNADTRPDTPPTGYPIPSTYAHAHSPSPLPPTPVPPPPTTKAKSISSEVAVATSRPDVESLLDYLDEQIESNGSRKPGRIKKSRDAMRLLIDKDNRSPEQIRAAIDYATGDEFWRSNILSAPKLREKFDQLRLQAQRSGWKPTDRHQRDADFWQTEMAGALATDQGTMKEIEA